MRHPGFRPIAGLTVVLVGFFWLTEEYTRFNRESQALRQDYIPGQKAIIASGHAETDEIRWTLELGARGAVLKPYTLERISGAIQAALRS